jgi:uncharacterized protein YqjF (DUF2071 family)
MTFTMAGRLNECILLAYRTPADSVRHLVPAGLSMVTHGEWAFWNIVACRIEKMRPLGLPAGFGKSYHHVAYRIYVSAQTKTEGEVQGLYFVHSDADIPLIATAGNWFTDFKFHRAKISLESTIIGGALTVQSDIAFAHMHWDHKEPDAQKERSAFASRNEARQFLKYRPFGLFVKGNRLQLAEVLRDESHWREEEITVGKANWKFLNDLGQKEIALELATRVAPIDYRWRLGRSLPLA